MKKRIVCLLLALIALCSAAASAELEIVCSLFPQYDFTKRIAGERANVTQLLPGGVDSHGYEPSAREMVKTDAADLFIYTDDLLEGWVKNLSGGFSHVKMIRCADGIDLEALNEAWEESDPHEHEHSHGHTYDAHIWLDPTLAEVMCLNILTALIEADPAGESIYRENCEACIGELRELDQRFSLLFQAYPDATLYFGGKFAYSHFLRHYGVSYETAYATCSDEGEPGVRAIMRMVNEMKKTGARVVFTDEMSNGEIARAIGEQVGADVLIFHTAHNLSKEDFKKGLTFIDIMNANYENLSKALNEGKSE